MYTVNACEHACVYNVYMLVLIIIVILIIHVQYYCVSTILLSVCDRWIVSNYVNKRFLLVRYLLCQLDCTCICIYVLNVLYMYILCYRS